MPLRLFRMNLRAKLLVLALLLAWLPLVGVGWLGLSSLDLARSTAVETATGALRDQAESTLAKRAADKAELYNTILHNVQDDVQGVASYARALIAAGPAPLGVDGIYWAVPGGPSEANQRAYSATVARAQQFNSLLRSVVTQNDLISLGYIAFEDGGVVAFDHDIISKLPREYDPRKRPWYQTARTTGRTVWVDTYVDA
ncbi:MAG: histidine kinase, partial [Roseiflexaceae bacterium]|nr:histidine kinase [Roseiflexaceae bacterium]